MPCFYVGGRLPPDLSGDRLNPFGWVLLATGVLTLAFAAWSAFGRAGPPFSGSGVIALLAVLQVLSGLSLLRSK